MTRNSRPSTPPRPSTLVRNDGAVLAYHRTPGRLPGVVFLTGYRSDMTGQKALRLEAVCRARGQAFVRFDYFGHGASSGAFTDGTVGRWTEDTVEVLDRLTEGRQVLVGSSLGGWIMVLAALARPGRIAALVGVAAAPDFTEDLLVNRLSTTEREVLARDGVVLLFSPYDPEPTPVTRLIIEEGRHHLVLRGSIPLRCPVRLIHALDDSDVPWQTSLALARCLESRDVELTLVKAAGHRMSEPADLDRLSAILVSVLDHLED